jgi:hypothetical protein
MLVVFFLSLEFSGGFLFLPVCGFVLLVFVELRTLVSLNLLLDLFTYGRLVLFLCGVGSVCCPGELKRKEENNQHSPIHSITTKKSLPRSSLPRDTSIYHTKITNQNHYKSYNHNVHTILTILTVSTVLVLVYNIQQY